MANCIERFLDEELSLIEFDDKSDAIAAQTEDQTIKRCHVAYLSRYYDIDVSREALRDKRGVYCKEEWDFLYRVLLLLRSDGELITEVQTRWSWEQIVPVVMVVPFIIAFAYIDASQMLITLLVVLPIISGVALWRSDREKWSKRDEAMSPFSTISEILAARRRVPSFVKRRYVSAPDPEMPGGLLGKIFWSIAYVPMMLVFVLCALFALIALNPVFIWMWARPQRIHNTHIVFPDSPNLA